MYNKLPHHESRFLGIWEDLLQPVYGVIARGSTGPAAGEGLWIVLVIRTCESSLMGFPTVLPGPFRVTFSTVSFAVIFVARIHLIIFVMIMPLLSFAAGCGRTVGALPTLPCRLRVLLTTSTIMLAIAAGFNTKLILDPRPKVCEEVHHELVDKLFLLLLPHPFRIYGAYRSIGACARDACGLTAA